MPIYITGTIPLQITTVNLLHWENSQILISKHVTAVSLPYWENSQTDNSCQYTVLEKFLGKSYKIYRTGKLQAIQLLIYCTVEFPDNR